MVSSLTTRPPFWSLHTHSKFSVNDAMPSVADNVERAVELGYPALGLTDHGNMSGSVQLYKACRAAGIEPLPGCELYITDELEERRQGNNMHLTVAAFTEEGYRNLVNLVSLSHRQFFHKPRLDLADFAAYAEAGLLRGLVATTGCYFGLIPTVARLQGERAAVNIAKTLDRWFERVYVEIQHHGIHTEDQDDDLHVGDLLSIAEMAGLPYLLTQDSHYAACEDRPLHDTLKELVSFSEDPSEATFPGETGYHMVDAAHFKRLLEPEVLGTALDNLADLAAAARCRIPELEKFSAFMPDVTLGGDPDKELAVAVQAGLTAKLEAAGIKNWNPYLTRSTEELEVARATGSSGYLLLVKAVVDFCNAEDIWYWARGSANNSLLVWALGISTTDPIRWGNRPERFISIDRTKPPDVDLDVDNERRGEIIAHLNSKYFTSGIVTFMRYSLKGEETGEGRGSLRVRYFSTARKQGKEINNWEQVPKEDQKRLYRLSDLRLLSGSGRHPSGQIVVDERGLLDRLPMSWAVNAKQLVCGYAMDDVEELGYVKLDVLGSKTVTAVRVACELIAPDDPRGFWESIPEGDKDTFARLRAGKTAGCFQLEGPSQTIGLKKMAPKNVEDVIAAQALFRPAARRSGAEEDFLARRKGVDAVPDLHADLLAETKLTYGVPLYQEQVIGMLRRIGMDIVELNKLLKAVKASNDNVAKAQTTIAAALPRIRELAFARGWNDGDVAVLVDAVQGYADYGFNRGHAVAYGVVAYRTAYLAAHHAPEFWTGQLVAYSGGNDDKEAVYLSAARREGVRVLGAHVNRSSVTYSFDPETRAIRKGLLSIKGVGIVSAAELAEKAPYRSLLDLGQRVLPKKVSGAKQLALHEKPEHCGGVIAALEDYRALEDIPETHADDQLVEEKEIA